jgi:mRNA interferase MazF
VDELAQGQIWIAELPPPINRRPVLILTRTGALAHLEKVTIATISRKIRGIDTEVVLSTADGVAQACAVSLDNIITLPQHCLSRYITRLSAERMNEVFEAIRQAFDLPYWSTDLACREQESRRAVSLSF